VLALQLMIDVDIRKKISLCSIIAKPVYYHKYIQKEFNLSWNALSPRERIDQSLNLHIITKFHDDIGSYRYPNYRLIHSIQYRA